MAMNKRQKAILNAVEPGKAYAFDDAIKIIKTATKAKFVESVDVAVRLGVDAKKSDQQVRGSTVLPAGTGKTVRVAVFVPAGTNTATRTVLPVPAGSTVEPRTCWSDFLASTPRRTATSTDSTNLALVAVLMILIASSKA